MPLYWFLLVISALASDSLPVREVPQVRAVLASIGVMIGWALLAHLAARNASRQVLAGEVGYLPAATVLGTQMEWLRWLGLALSTWILVGFGIAGVIGQYQWAQEWLVLKSLVLLAPALMATAWSWICELRFDMKTHPQQVGATSWFSHLLGTFRLQGAWLLMPVLMLLTLIDSTQWMFGIDSSTGALLSGGVAMLGLPLLLPTILGRIWNLGPISEPEQAAWCDSIVQAVPIRGLPVLQWNTGGTICTAMVAGFVPRFRRLLLSDALLWRLSPQQTAMVLLHELAHIRRWHLPIRLLVLLPVWLIASTVTYCLGSFPYADVVGIAAGLLLSLVALRQVAYRTEYDADAYAIKLASELSGQVVAVPTDKAAACRALSTALLNVTADNPSARKATWLHPSIQSRCDRLAAIVQNEAVPVAEVDLSQLAEPYKTA